MASFVYTPLLSIVMMARYVYYTRFGSYILGLNYISLHLCIGIQPRAAMSFTLQLTQNVAKI